MLSIESITDKLITFYCFLVDPRWRDFGADVMNLMFLNCRSARIRLPPPHSHFRARFAMLDIDKR